MLQMNYEFRINFSKSVKKLVFNSEILIRRIDLGIEEKMDGEKIEGNMSRL